VVLHRAKTLQCKTMIKSACGVVRAPRVLHRISGGPTFWVQNSVVSRRRLLDDACRLGKTQNVVCRTRWIFANNWLSAFGSQPEIDASKRPPRSVDGRQPFSPIFQRAETDLSVSALSLETAHSATKKFGAMLPSHKVNLDASKVSAAKRNPT